MPLSSLAAAAKAGKSKKTKRSTKLNMNRYESGNDESTTDAPVSTRNDRKGNETGTKLSSLAAAAKAGRAKMTEKPLTGTAKKKEFDKKNESNTASVSTKFNRMRHDTSDINNTLNKVNSLSIHERSAFIPVDPHEGRDSAAKYIDGGRNRINNRGRNGGRGRVSHRGVRQVQKDRNSPLNSNGRGRSGGRGKGSYRGGRGKGLHQGGRHGQRNRISSSNHRIEDKRGKGAPTSYTSPINHPEQRKNQSNINNQSVPYRRRSKQGDRGSNGKFDGGRVLHIGASRRLIGHALGIRVPPADTVRSDNEGTGQTQQSEKETFREIGYEDVNSKTPSPIRGRWADEDDDY